MSSMKSGRAASQHPRTQWRSTKCVFVVAGFNTLWERVEKKAAYGETKQLTRKGCRNA